LVVDTTASTIAKRRWKSLAQKVLIHKKREREDRAKDILYMHDTLVEE
jgi:hypothetical protein